MNIIFKCKHRKNSRVIAESVTFIKDLTSFHMAGEGLLFYNNLMQPVENIYGKISFSRLLMGGIWRQPFFIVEDAKVLHGGQR